MKNRLYILFLLLTLILSCSKTKPEYTESEVELFAYQEAPIGGINFVLLKNGKFIVTRSGMFESEKFRGYTKISKDSIFLTYSDKSIDFQKIPLPQKIKVGKHLIYTELKGRKYHLNIRNSE